MAVDIRSGYLENISIHFPKASRSFISDLSRLLVPFLFKEGDAHSAIPSFEYIYPKISFDSNSDKGFANVDFVLTTNEIVSVDIRNITGMDRHHPFSYGHIELEDVNSRFVKNGLGIVGIDHIGLNLPWFNRGVHPAIADLRNRLKASCLYHSR